MSEASDIVRRSVAFVVACTNADAPDAICEAIGRSIVLNKPIICVVKPGEKVPDKLSLLVDRYVEWVDDQNALAIAIRDAIVELGLLKGVDCVCDACKEKANSDRSWQNGNNSQN